MDDLDVQAFQASVSKTDVERVLRRIQSHQGVIALMVTNRDGLILRSNLDLNTTRLYAVQYQSLINMTRSAVRELDPQNELCFIRVRNKRHEIMVAPTEDLVLIVVQLIGNVTESVQEAVFEWTNSDPQTNKKNWFDKFLIENAQRFLPNNNNDINY